MLQLLLGSLFVVNSTPLFAQGDTLQLPTHEVTAERIVVGKGFAAFAIEVDETSAGNSLSDVLNKQSGFFLKTYGQGALATAGIRGTGAQHTQVYWNGLSLNYSHLGLSDLSLYPMWLFERAEMHLGAASLVDGSGGLGAAVQLNNQAKAKEGFQLDLLLTGGSFGQFQTGAKIVVGNAKWQSHTKFIYQEAANDFDYINTAVSEFPTEFQINAAYQQGHLMQEVSFAPNAKNTFMARAWMFDSYRELPTTILTSQTGETQVDRGIKAQVQWNNKRKLFQSSFQSGFTRDYLEYNHPIADINAISIATGWQNQWRGSLIVGKQLVIKPMLTSRIDWVEVDDYATDARQVRIAGVVQTDWYATKRLEASLILRQELIDGKAAPFLPALGINYTLIDGEKHRFAINANAALNYHAPSLNDLYWAPGGNIDLLPETSQQTEAGLKWDVKGKALSSTLKVNAFYSLIDNWIQWRPGSEGFWMAQNLKKVNNRGAEVYGQFSYKKEARSIVLSGTYSHTLSSDLSDESSETTPQLIYVPFHKATARLQVSGYPKKIQFTANMSHLGLRYTDASNNNFLPNFQVVDVALGTTPIAFGNHKLAARFSVNNVFDTHYQAIAWRPMPGINYQISINYSILKQKNEIP